MRKGYADSVYGQVHYRELGEGPAVLLLHQTASSGAMWERFQPLLAQRGFRTLAVDTPGFGLSDRPPEQPGIAGYARSLIGFLDSLGIEKAHVVGCRTGSSIAVDAVARAPERFDRVVLLTMLAVVDDAERQSWRDRNLGAPYGLDGKGEFLDSRVKPWVQYFAAEDDGDAYLRELVATLQAGPLYGYGYFSVAEHDPWPLFPTITHPALVLNPLHDSQYESTGRVAAALPNATYVELPATTETRREPGFLQVPDRCPDLLARQIGDFLSG